MPPRRPTAKGEPDFHYVNDEKLKSFLELTQQMIFSYKYSDKEKTKVLEDIWKDLSVEDANRSYRSAIEEIDRQEREDKSGTTAPLLKKAPKMRKSPAKRKI